MKIGKKIVPSKTIARNELSLKKIPV